ncbi:Phospholipase D1, partial [Serendipita sp. 399]
MAGKPFKVGRFAHTLRVRLMREHLGVDVDSLYEEDVDQQPDSVEPAANLSEPQKWDPDNEQEEISPEHPKLEKESFKPIKGETSAAARLLGLAATNIKQVFSSADAAVAYGRGEVAREVGFAPGKDHDMVGDKALEEEREMYGRDGQREPGFASSKVPTLEEKTVMEKRPKETAGDSPLAKALELGGVGDGPGEARTQEGGELYGAPADAMPGDHEVPHARTPSKEDADEQERGAVRARTLLRKHLNVPLGTKNWTIPTPAP